MSKQNKEYTIKEWQDKGRELFGPDEMDWKFKCPVCGHIAAVKDWKDVGAPSGAAAFSCVGRWLPEQQDAFTADKRKGPCNYAGGGLFRLNPISVHHPDGKIINCFEFAEEEVKIAAEQIPHWYTESTDTALVNRKRDG